LRDCWRVTQLARYALVAVTAYCVAIRRISRMPRTSLAIQIENSYFSPRLGDSAVQPFYAS